MSIAQPSPSLSEAELPFLDVDSDLFRADPLGALRRARESGRLHYSRRGIEVLAHEDVRQLLTDSRLESQDAAIYRQYGAQPMLSSFAEHGLLVALRGQKHERIRRVFLAAFRTRTVDAHRQMMREVASQLVAAMPSNGTPVDFVEAFSNPYPMQVLCRVIGIPVADIAAFSVAATKLHLLAATPIERGFDEIEHALQTLRDYCLALVADRTAQPRDDVISGLVAAQVSAGRITDDELAWNVANLIFAGQDTTRYQLASALRAVAAEPGYWDRMPTDRGLVEQIAEETLRIEPVVNFIVRIAQEDFDYRGVHVGAGRRVILNVQAASRDPEQFTSPDAFCPRETGRHRESFDVGFGLGSHYCLGAGLARAEIEEALEVLSRHLTDVRILRTPVMTETAAMLHGPEELTISYRAR